MASRCARRTPRLLRAGALAAALTASTGVAWADSKDADAERLFREGQKLLEERKYGEACPKFEQAYKKDGQVGTLLNLAFCHKEQGALWYAWLEFREAEVMAGAQKKLDRRDFAKQSRVDLEKQLPKVVIDNAAKSNLSEVLVEDRHVPEAEKGERFTAEQGQRKFTFRAPGKKPATSMVTIMKGGKDQHILVPDLVDAPPEEPPPPTEPPRVIIEAPPEDPGHGQRVLGYVALGAAGFFTLGGALFGILTITNECANNKCTQNPPPDASAAYQNGQLTSTLSTIGFIAAGAFAVGAGILIFTAPSAPSSGTGSTGSGAGAAGSGGAGGSSPASGVRVRPTIGLGALGLQGTF